MKSTIIFCLALLLTSTSCPDKKKQEDTKSSPAQTQLNQKATPEKVVTNELQGFFLKNTYKQEENIKLLIIKDETEFGNLFGIGKTMTNTIVKPDFNTSTVAALVLKPSNIQTSIQIESATNESGILNTNFNVKTGEKQSFTSQPIYLFTFNKNVPAKQIQLLINGEKKEIQHLN